MTGEIGPLPRPASFSPVVGTARSGAVAQSAPPARRAAVDTELHFSRDENSGRIVVQVRDLEGRVIRIPPATALEVMSGSQGVVGITGG